MSQRTAVALFAVALVGLGGWALAQQGAPAPKKPETEAGRFAVSTSSNTAILVDTATGKTWTLHESAQFHRAMWLPAERIDDSREAAKWQMEQEEVRQDLERRRLRQP